MMVSTTHLLTAIRHGRRPQVERLAASLDLTVAGSDLMLALRVAARIRRLAIVDELQRMRGAA